MANLFWNVTMMVFLSFLLPGLAMGAGKVGSTNIQEYLHSVIFWTWGICNSLMLVLVFFQSQKRSEQATDLFVAMRGGAKTERATVRAEDVKQALGRKATRIARLTRKASRARARANDVNDGVYQAIESKIVREVEGFSAAVKVLQESRVDNTESYIGLDTIKSWRDGLKL